MYKHLFITVTLLATAMSPSFASAAPMSKVEYSAAKTRISADYKADQKLCTALKANAKDICSAEAKGKEKVALAELEFGYTGKPADSNKARVARGGCISRRQARQAGRRRALGRRGRRA